MTIRDGRDGILQGCKTPSHIVTPSRKGQWKHIKHMHIDKRIQRINLEELHEKEHSDARGNVCETGELLPDGRCCT